ncbi:MAG TPA: VCBS repeat-containing protein, partial [Polyangia bacterium]|nr:VCBS repeat-containing protein [Polyangia bacterium]
IGDIDGDGHNDIVVGNQWWYRNVDGKGAQWESLRTVTGFDDSPLTNLGDLDGDGDLDIVMCTHFGGNAAWAENSDGMGGAWTLHRLAGGKNKLHSIFAMDFDNDGDLDVFSGESTGNAWIWENTNGKGAFTEHSVARNARGHDARVGDVDCDGDLDIAGKPWGEGQDPEPRDHVYLQNMTVELGGRAVFTRPPGEVWHKTQERKFCP